MKRQPAKLRQASPCGVGAGVRWGEVVRGDPSHKVLNFSVHTPTWFDLRNPRLVVKETSAPRLGPGNVCGPH